MVELENHLWTLGSAFGAASTVPRGDYSKMANAAAAAASSSSSSN